jgi:outer membrane protein, heavy metal efflux system
MHVKYGASEVKNKFMMRVFLIGAYLGVAVLPGYGQKRLSGLIVGKELTKARQQFPTGNEVNPAFLQPAALSELLEDASRNNPEVRAAQKKYEGSRLRTSMVSSLPDPILSIASNNIGNPIPATTVGEEDMSLLGFSFMQEIPFPGKLQLQGRMAEKVADSDWHEYQDIQLKVISELKQTYYRWHFVHQALAVLEKNFDLLNQLSKITEARYGVGQGIQQDVLRAQTELSQLTRRRVELEKQRESLATKINTLLNRPPEAPLGAPVDFPKLELSTSLNELYETAQRQSPRLGQSQAKIEENTFALNLSRKEYYPDFTVEAGWATRGHLPDMWETRVDVRVPLYFWRKQRYAVRESAQAVAEAQHEYDATTQSLLFHVKDDYLMAKSSEQLMELYTRTLLPQATLTLESAMASYQVGKLEFVSLLTNFRNVLDYELEYYDQFANFHEALARIEETTGRPMVR